MIVILIFLYVLIALTVMTVWFVFDPSSDDEIPIIILSIIWPIAIPALIITFAAKGTKILANKIREKYVPEE